MVRIDRYKDREAVTVESAKLRMTLLPKDGAKIASLVAIADGKEFLLTREGTSYRTLSYEGSYIDSECSAFDDMFPTIDPCVCESGLYKGGRYLDHGEVCRLPHEVTLTDGGVHFRTQLLEFPILCEKTVRPSEDGGFDVDYRIENQGAGDLPCIWAGHLMLRGEDGMRLETPYAPDAPAEMIFATEGYDPKELPRDRLLGFAPNGAAYKFYYTQPIERGCFAMRYPDGRALSFTYDEKKLPYLGVWINNGEFQGIYNIAPEPCNIPFDAPDKAAQRGFSATLSAGACLEFRLHISLV